MKTAVEWLQDTWLNYPDLCSYDKIQEWFEQAKEMEKEQMHKCASFWRGKENEIEKSLFYLYYNETFKSE
jgi:hypothetical protein